MINLYSEFIPEFISINFLHRDKFLEEEGVYSDWNMFIPTEGFFCCGKEGTVIKPGDIVIFAPNEVFNRRVIKEVSFFSIHFKWTFHDSQSYKYMHLLPKGKIEFSDSSRILSTAFLLTKSYCGSIKKELCNHFLRDIWYQYYIETNTEKATKISNGIIETALKSINIINTAELTISSLAKECNVSQVHLINLFKKHLGQTPSEYLTEHKIQRAKELLTDTDYSISEIAEYCGFSNIYYFSNRFKKQVGVSPNMFRKMYRV